MLDRPISEIPLVFLDTETTGLNPRFGDRVVEIALARFRGGVMEDHYVSLVNPGRSIPLRVIQIHGITDEDVRGQPTFGQILPELQALLKDTVIVGHNAQFDLGFVGNEFRLAQHVCPANLVLDTLTLLRRYFNFPSNGLRPVAEHLGIRTAPRHRALGDALTTHSIFEFISKRLALGGAQTLGDILELQGGTIPWQETQYPTLPPIVEEALRLNRRLFLHYVDVFGEHTERWVSPIGVRADGDYVFLRAYCHLRGTERQFRLDRVVEMRVESAS